MKRLTAMIAALFMGWSTTAMAETDYEYNWIEGGIIVDLGEIASVDLDPDFLFLDGEDTKKVALDYGEPVSGFEIGSIYPVDEEQTWAVYFDYEETGHIKDDEKIDAKALLESYKAGAEEANKDRQPGERFYVTGWDIEPFYDEDTHNLTWSLLLEDENKDTFLNYNTRILTREGNISVILVTEPQNRETDKQMLQNQILSQLEIKEGKKYTDFDKSTDKVANYGLSALILGGTGLAVAKKAGLLAVILAFAKKFGVLIIAGIAALWSLIRKKKKKPATEPVEPAEPSGE
ncbi:putative membrane-anchored protein [Sporosarcina luteola]|nr:putative membrane-anchored protein [Sporosarcina luteola]